MCTTSPIRLLLTAALLVAGPPGWATDDTPGDGLADYAILTPAVEGRFVVVSGVDYTGLLPPFVNFGNFGDRDGTRVLRALVERERYDPAPVLAERLLQALVGAGFSAVHEPIPRRRAGSVQPLAWSDVPEAPRGRVMIDVSIRWICFCSDVVFTRFYPAVALNWRLLGPDQRLIEPSRQLIFYHYPEYNRREKSRDDKPLPDPSSSPPEIPVSEACGYISMKPAEQDPQALLRCVDEMLVAATGRLVFDLKAVAARRLQHPRQ